MSRYYNNHYNYDDIGLWNDDFWADRGAEMAPLGHKLVNLSREKQIREGTFGVDRYADRHDEIMPLPFRAPFFTDVVEEWRQLGMEFQAVGMVSLAMVPMSVIRHEKHDPKILFLPFAGGRDAHSAMNAIEANREVLLKAAEEEVFVMFMTFCPPKGGPFQEAGLEAEGLYRIDFQNVYMDISLLKEAGLELKDVEGLTWADEAVESVVAGVPVVDVSKKWQGRTAHQATINRMYKGVKPSAENAAGRGPDPNGIRPIGGVPGYNDDMHIHSTAGRIQAESMHLEADYIDGRDPKLHQMLDKRGLKYEEHPFDTGYWISLAPKSVFDKPDHKIPLLICMKEPRLGIPFMTLTALQFYAPFVEIAANGECMIMFFALEYPDDNEILVDLIKECAEKYPVDLSRVYITGQSHNGYLALEFYRRHPDLIACAATLCDPISLDVGAQVYYYDENTPKTFAQHDMPLININGQLENKLYTSEKGSAEHRKFAEHYVWRLEAFRAKNMYTADEIMAARDSADYVTAINGIPADRTEVRYCMGTELYISDVQNVDGKWHLRFVTIENTPHMIMPQMGEIAWSFMRRFARDPKTGETIERY